MNREQEFFIKILSDHIGKRKTNVAMNLDWQLIKKLAHSHQVEGIVFYQCNDFLPEGIRESFEKAFGAAVFYNTNRKALLKEVAIALRKNNVSFFSVKGFSVADYYPIPLLRTMGDCDIIVHKDDLPSAMRVMRGIGFHGIDNEKVQDWACKRNDILFELHSSLVGNEEHANDFQKFFFNEYDRYVKDELVDWNFHFLFLIMHLRKHFINSGVGIRQFIDIATILLYGPELNWNWIREKLDELDLFKFSQACFSLIEKWFGVRAPILIDRLDPCISMEVTDRVLSNGVFGNENPDNLGNYERNVLIKSNGTLWLNRIIMLIRFLFPSYSYMRTYKGCGYLDGRIYLIPIAWMHRAFLYFQHKGRSSIKIKMKRILTPKEELNAQRDYLEKMGL